MGGAFAASVKLLVQHSRASSKEHHSWPSHLQADLKAIVRKTLTLEREEDNHHDKFADCYCPLPWSSRVFVGVLALSQARRDDYL